MLSRASIRCGVLRRCVPTCTTRLCLRAAASIAWPSTHVHADRLLHVDIGAGFTAAIIGSACQWSGVAIQHDVQVLLLEHLAVVGDRCAASSSRPGGAATMSAASASMFLSTSHNDTTSTGATWIRRNRSILPYQPQPMRPTRFFGRRNQPRKCRRWRAPDRRRRFEGMFDGSWRDCETIAPLRQGRAGVLPANSNLCFTLALHLARGLPKSTTRQFPIISGEREC